MPVKKVKPPQKLPKRQNIVTAEVNDKRVTVGGVKTTVRRAKFAKEVVKNGGRKLKAAKDAGFVNPKDASYLAKMPDVQAIMHVTRQQIRGINPLSIEEIKQLGAELSMVSIADLAEPDGTFNLPNIRKRGLSRFIKEVEIDSTTDMKTGKTKTRTKLKGYSRLEALKLLAGIKEQEENRDLALVQALSALFTEYPHLLKQKDHVFSAFAKTYALGADTVESLFERFGDVYLPDVIDVEAS